MANYGAKFKRDEFLKRFRQKLDKTIINGLMEELQLLKKCIQAEIPKSDDGKAVHLRDAIYIDPPTTTEEYIYSGRMTIGNKDDVPYARAVWKGLSEPESNKILHPKAGPGYMEFPIERWPEGPRSLIRRKKDGREVFIFFRVKHWSPANDFVRRGREQYNKQSKKKQLFGKRVVTVFGESMDDAGANI